MKKWLFSLSLITMPGLARMLTPYESQALWDRRSIKVCWANQIHLKKTFALNEKNRIYPYAEWQKQVIQQIISQEFTEEKTGITFEGWKDCSDDLTNEDIALFRLEPPIPEGAGETFQESGGRATIGQRGQIQDVIDATTQSTRSIIGKSSLPYKNFILLNTRTIAPRLNREDQLRLIALHEFGHAAGLRHQHVRFKNSQEDPNCQKTDGLILKPEPILDSTLLYGDYDPNSIMNYCFINLLSGKVGLVFRAKHPENLIHLKDESLFSTRSVGRNESRQEISIRIGLSSQDIEALRHMYP